MPQYYVILLDVIKKNIALTCLKSAQCMCRYLHVHVSMQMFPGAFFFLHLIYDLSRRFVQGLCNKLDIFSDIIINGLYIRKLGTTIESSGLLVVGCNDTRMIGGFSSFPQK